MECPACRWREGVRVALEPAEDVALAEGPKPAVRRRRLRCPRCRQTYEADPWWWERGPGRRLQETGRVEDA